MRYRWLNKKSKLTVSEIGIGGHQIWYDEHFQMGTHERAGIIGRALDLGVNYFDTTFLAELESLRTSLDMLNRGQDAIVSVMTVEYFTAWRRSGRAILDFTKAEIEDRLRLANREILDVYHLGAIETSYDEEAMGDSIDACLQLRDEGKIRLFGFSSHDVELAAKVISHFPIFDTVMVPYNFVERTAMKSGLFELAEQHDIGVIAMKSMCWRYYGIPVTTLQHPVMVTSLTGLCRDKPIARAALKWVLAESRVSTVIPAVNSTSELEDNISASGEVLLEEDATLLRQCDEALIDQDGVPVFFAAVRSKNADIRRYGWSRLRRALSPSVPFDPYAIGADNSPIIDDLLTAYLQSASTTG